MDVVDEGRLWLQRLAAQGTLERAAEVLAARDLTAVVLKGAWLLSEVYGKDALRPITDVDLLVRPRQFAAACAALVSAGFVPCGGDVRQRVFRHAQLALDVDLHRALFPPGCFGLGGDAVVTRSRPAPLPALRWPEPMDGFAHLIGHFALHRGIPRNLARSQDFECVGQHFALHPQCMADHLSECGLARATRYVLDAVARAHGHDDAVGFCGEVRRALPKDRLGDAVVLGCRWAMPLVPPSQPWGALLSCLLEPSLGRAALSAVRRPIAAATFQRYRR